MTLSDYLKVVQFVVETNSILRFGYLLLTRFKIVRYFYFLMSNCGKSIKMGIICNYLTLFDVKKGEFVSYRKQIDWPDMI